MFEDVIISRFWISTTSSVHLSNKPLFRDLSGQWVDWCFKHGWKQHKILILVSQRRTFETLHIKHCTSTEEQKQHEETMWIWRKSATTSSYCSQWQHPLLLCRWCWRGNCYAIHCTPNGLNGSTNFFEYKPVTYNTQ